MRGSDGIMSANHATEVREVGRSGRVTHFGGALIGLTHEHDGLSVVKEHDSKE